MSALRWGPIHCVPSFHNRLQFAREVRRAFGELKPDVVAIELPDIYYSDLLQGIERLPRLSLLCLQQQSDRFSYIPVFPSDSMIEALRLARENQLPAALIDLAVADYAIHVQPMAVPDDEAIASLGLEGFYA
ncbi:MAG: conjugal transfer protein TraB, partial [Candidatus Melainabacteria bacterium HGW-Melainabacteria-1]